LYPTQLNLHQKKSLQESNEVKHVKLLWFYHRICRSHNN